MGQADLHAIALHAGRHTPTIADQTSLHAEIARHGTALEQWQRGLILNLFNAHGKHVVQHAVCMHLPEFPEFELSIRPQAPPHISQAYI